MLGIAGDGERHAVDRLAERHRSPVPELGAAVGVVPQPARISSSIPWSRTLGCARVLSFPSDEGIRADSFGSSRWSLACRLRQEHSENNRQRDFCLVGDPLIESQMTHQQYQYV